MTRYHKLLQALAQRLSAELDLLSPDQELVEEYIVAMTNLIEIIREAQMEVQYDAAYERATMRARNNDFEETGGKDWT